ncbi:MaoC/PaaZ C-terminal domain-containing protein, partial [Streptomyces sp. NPDC005921]
MQFGRTYEEFEVGATYKHWPGKTVTEYDDHLFCLLTMNHHPLHMDTNYAEKTTDFGKNVVVGNYIYSLLLGMSVPTVFHRYWKVLVEPVKWMPARSRCSRATLDTSMPSPVLDEHRLARTLLRELRDDTAV